MQTLEMVITVITAYVNRLIGPVRRRTSNEFGYAIETVVIGAALAAIAIAVGAILLTKITGKANSINLGP